MDRIAQLAKEIEEARNKLHRCFAGSNGEISARLKSLSRKLDRLIVEYTKIKEKKG